MTPLALKVHARLENSRVIKVNPIVLGFVLRNPQKQYTDYSKCNPP